MDLDTTKLEEFLKEKLKNEVEDEWFDFKFESSGPPTCELNLYPLGKWYGIKALINYKGNTWDYTTDRLKGDPEDVHAWYDWLGLAETVPKIITKPEELDEWALISTYYKITFRDVQYPGPFGFHEGRMVKDFNKDTGIGELYVVEERKFEDEPPISKCREETFDLNKIKK